MPFTSPLITQSVRGTPFRILIASLTYLPTKGNFIVVPARFLTDFASIPKFIRGWIDQDSGQIRDAAVVHDYLYSLGGSTGYSRKRSDAIFKEAMLSLGMNRFKAWSAWSAVRMFGGSSYKD